MRIARIQTFLAVLSASILFASSCTMPDVAKDRTQGENFARQVVDEIKPDWNAEGLDGKLADGLSIDDCRLAFSKFRKALGPIKSTEQLVETSVNFEAGINVPDFKGSYKAHVSCKKGPAVIELSEIHFKGKWIVTGVNVTSPLFEKNPDLLIEPKVKAEAQKYATSIARQLLTDWKFELVEKEADSYLQRELKNEIQALAFKGLLAAGKESGRIKTFAPPKFSNWSAFKGLDVYTFVCEEHTDKGVKVQLMLNVARESGKWKLHSIYLKGKTKTG